MIYIIITTCINNKIGVKNSEHRKKRYLDCITTLLNLIKNDTNIKPIIVENNGKRDTYLDKLDCDIVYTDNNKFSFANKGGNELLDIKDVIKNYNIRDNDIIIKLTGRYKILNLDFINLVKDNSNIDAFLKFFNVSTQRYHNNKDDCVLGLFAIRCKYLKSFNYNFKRSPEVEFSSYVSKNVKNIMSVKDLHLECCFANALKILRV